MDFTKFLDYLKNKENKSELEALVLYAIEDGEFMGKYESLSYLKHCNGNFQHVLNSPQVYSSDNEPQKSLYFRFLVEISNTYNTYLYEKKGKFASLKSSVAEVENRVKEAEGDLKNIKKTSKLVSGAKILDVYAKEFEKRAGKFRIKAENWRKNLYISFILLAVLVGLSFTLNMFDLSFCERYLAEEFRKYPYVAVIAIKAIILLVTIQVMRFFHRNYNANKHLEYQSLHKCDVLRSLLGVYNTIDTGNKEVKDELIKTGALIAFQTSESGYITTKEGAGNSDTGLYSIINSVVKK